VTSFGHETWCRYDKLSVHGVKENLANEQLRIGVRWNIQAMNQSSSEALWNIWEHARYLRWDVDSPTLNPRAGGPPFVGCPRLFIQYIRSGIPYPEALSFVCNRRALHAFVTRDPPNIYVVGGTCGMHGRGRSVCKVLVRRPLGQRPLEDKCAGGRCD
jgi:hypothetical protein